MSRVAPTPDLTTGELAGLMSAVTEATARLQRTHETLQAEVVRLRAELGAANAELERSRRLAALGQVAAGIAHEVRNPLASIGLYARLLQDDLADRPGPRGVATRISAAVRSLDAVVGDVLAFAREIRARVEPTDPGDLIASAAEACCPGLVLAPSADGRRAGVWQGVTVIAGPGGPREGAGAVMMCDRGLARQALVNVLQNAIGVMRESGGASPVVEAAWSARRHGAGPRSTAIVVTDRGPGIPAEVLDRVFNPFFTTRPTGTGLGLAIVHRIMDAHGGRVRIWNNADRGPGSAGATVELVFPGGPASDAGATGRADVVVRRGRPPAGPRPQGRTPVPPARAGRGQAVKERG